MRTYTNYIIYVFIGVDHMTVPQPISKQSKSLDDSRVSRRSFVKFLRSNSSCDSSEEQVIRDHLQILDNTRVGHLLLHNKHYKFYSTGCAMCFFVVHLVGNIIK